MSVYDQSRQYRTIMEDGVQLIWYQSHALNVVMSCHVNIKRTLSIVTRPFGEAQTKLDNIMQL